ncbi:hypothetical protein DERF_008806 [Dermatophagoides farinae]|uniref:Transmembrane protein n=1 Tax=Dermatophagoides farinae TaxID=6954 RepID=A0A922L5U4_DERFA|nr:hypothetical protein DERF_008806 [Dermatophagoides farinae]
MTKEKRFHRFTLIPTVNVPLSIVIFVYLYYSRMNVYLHNHLSDGINDSHHHRAMGQCRDDDIDTFE